MNKVDCSDERIKEIETHIEQRLGISEVIESKNEAGTFEIAEIDDQEQDFSEDDAREKVGNWVGGLFAGVLIIFEKKLEITKDQCTTLGVVWGRVVGKWYPTSMLNRTEQAGDAVSKLEPEAVAFQETWGIFGNRVLEKFNKNSKKVSENQENSINTETASDQDISLKNQENFRNDGGVQFPATMGQP